MDHRPERGARVTEPRERILVLRYRFIGDTVLTIPFLRNLRRAKPDAFIAWLVAPGSSDVVADCPYVDELIYWDPETIHADSRGAHRTLGAKVSFIRALRARRFDTAYVLKRSLSSALLASLSGARRRIGFATEGRGLLLTTRVPYRHDRHEVQNFLDVLRADGIPIADDHLELWSSPAEATAADAFLANNRISDAQPFAILHPFSAVEQRGWPYENFAELATRLTGLGLRVVLVGGPGDVSRFEPNRHLFGADVILAIGACSLRVTVSLLRRASLFVGNDSGIMHLAAAAGTPLVALFGPQSPVKFGPWSRAATVLYRAMPCSPCRQKFFTECWPSRRNRPECIESITVDDVFDASRERIENRKGNA